MLKVVGFFSISVVLSFVLFALLQVGFGEKIYTAHHAILWGLLEFTSWNCLYIPFYTGKEALFLNWHSAPCSINYINLLVGHPQLEYYYLMMANAKKSLLPGNAIHSFKMKLCGLIQAYLMDMNRWVFLVLIWFVLFQSNHICIHNKGVVMLVGPNYCS